MNHARVLGLVILFTSLAAPALPAQEAGAALRELEEAVKKLAAASDRSAVVQAKIQIQRIAHQAARPGAEAERARAAKVLADAYAATDLVEFRNVVAEALSVMGGKESVPALAAALSNPGAREMARFALVRIPAPEAASALREALRKERDPEFQVGLINALGSKRDQDSVGLLAERIEKSEGEVKLAALEALSRIPGGEAHLEKMYLALSSARGEAKVRERTRIFDSVVVLGETLIALGKREAAAELYARLLSEARSTGERCAAVIVLGAAGGARAAEAVAEALADEAEQVQGAALEALARMPAPQVFTLVRAQIAQAGSAPMLHAKLLRVLAGRKETEAGAVAAGSLRDRDASVRAAALRALEGRDDPRLAEALLEVIRAKEPAAAEGAVGVLGRLPGQAAARAITEGLKGTEGGTRAAILLALAWREDPASLEVFLAAARADSDEVRAAAYQGLGSLRSDDSVAVLIEGLSRKGPAAVAAERALERLGSLQATRGLIESARKTSGAPRAALVRVLGKRDGEAVLALLLEAARDPGEDIRIAALEALSRQKDPQVLPVLLQAAETGPEEVRPAAVLGCLRFGRTIEEKDKQAARGVYEKALGVARGREERSEAIQGLGRVGDENSLAVLKPLLEGQDRRLQRDAAAAILPIAAKLGERRPDDAKSLLMAALPLVPGSPAASRAVEALRKLGVDYDVAREAGFVTHWWLLGPFPNPEDKAFDQDLIDPDTAQVETGVEVKVGEKSLAWKHHHTPSGQGIVNLEEAVGRLDWVGAYAYAEVTVPAEPRVILKVGSDDSVVVWHNGKKLHGEKTSRGLNIDQDSVNTRLTPGKNRILLKVLNQGGPWAFALRITDRPGSPLKFEQRER